MTRKIAWEKWTDFTEDDGDDKKEEVKFAEFDDDIDASLLETLMIRTPLGVFSPDEPMSPSKMFDCWIMHTNFDLTEEEAIKIDEIAGVESFKVMTRYRAFIGVGKLFDFSSVRKAIQIALTESDIFQKIDAIMSEVGSKARWAIFVGDDGSTQTISTNHILDDEYDKKLIEIRELKNGNIFTNDQI